MVASSGQKAVIVVGAGGHAKVVCDALLLCDRTPVFLTDSNPKRWGAYVLGILNKGDDSLILDLDAGEVELANGIASTKDTSLRRKVFETWREKGYSFTSVRHPGSIIARDVVVGHGVQIFAGAIIQPSVILGDNVLINTRSSVDHDCSIGPHCHIAPGATISGFVRLDAGVHVGTGATILQNVHVGRESTIAAGAVVIGDVPENSLVRGVPGVVRPKNAS